MNGFILRGGLIYDGTGAPAYSADVLVREGKIQQIGKGSQRNRCSNSMRRDVL